MLCGKVKERFARERTVMEYYRGIPGASIETSKCF